MSDKVLYELTITAEAEVIPGPLTKIRKLCEEYLDEGDHSTGLAIAVIKIIDEG